MSTPVKTPWTHISEIRNRTREYIDKRRKGEIKSFRTPWYKLNHELVLGYEWQTINLLAGSSGIGKTAIKDQIIKEGMELNKDQNIVALEYQFEMTDIQTGARELTAPTGMSIKKLFSAEEGELVTDEEFEQIEQLHHKRKNDRIYQVSSPRKVDTMEKEILSFYEYAKKTYGDDVRVLISVDHALLIDGGMDDNSELDTIGNMAKMFLRIKKRVPVIVFILSQLNSYIEEPSRRENGKVSNFPTKRDLYGGKQLYFACDTVMIFMKPLADGISIYGPGRFDVTQGDYIFNHILKTRFSNPTTLTFKADMEHFRIEECDPPPVKK
jgi:replicative DNA helicase